MNDLVEILQVDLDEKGLVDPKVMQSKVSALQDELLKMPQADIRTYHSFRPGFYERTIIVPPWTVLTGAEHKTDYLVRLEQGTIAVNIDDQVKILTAPCEFIAKAGSQRAGRVFDEMVIWVDVYENPDNCRDIEELERRYYKLYDAPLMDDLNAQMNRAIRADYHLFLGQIGLTQDEMDQIVQQTGDLMPMPDGFHVVQKPSPIHGEGMFATKSFEPDELVCPGRIDGKRTPAGRFINHSLYANVKPVKSGGNIDFVALRAIREGEELLVDYRASMRVNFGAALQGEIPCLEQ